MVDRENNERAVVALRLGGTGPEGYSINAISSAYGKNKSSFSKWVAYGIKLAFTRFGKWVRTAAKAIAEKPETETAQLLLRFAELFDTDDG